MLFSSDRIKTKTNTRKAFWSTEGLKKNKGYLHRSYFVRKFLVAGEIKFLTVKSSQDFAKKK